MIIHKTHSLWKAAAVGALLWLVGCVHEPDPSCDALGSGDHLPAFAVTTLDGRTVTDQSFEGRRGAIVFFTTTCADCRRELPRLEHSYRALSDAKEEVEVICIARDDDEATVRSYWLSEGFTMPVAAPGNRVVYEKFAKSGVPRLYLTDGLQITAAYLEQLPANPF